MNEREHIALTEAQIIAAEKGDIQLETRDGRKVVQLVWLKPPYDQTSNDVLYSIFKDGETCCYPRAGKRESFHSSINDLFVSEPAIDFSEPDIPNDFMKVGEHITIEGAEFVVCEDVNNTTSCDECDLSLRKCRELKLKCRETLLKRVDALMSQSPKPLYEVGETIEIFFDGNWVDVEYRDCKNDHICVWFDDSYLCVDDSADHRKKQKPRIYISGRVKNLAYKEAFDLFETAETELIAKGYEVINPMKVVPFNEDWSWFDYLSADIKLMENCTHIYMLSNWRESGGASVEHEAAKWNNFTIIYQ